MIDSFYGSHRALGGEVDDLLAALVLSEVVGGPEPHFGDEADKHKSVANQAVMVA